jgi:hypothetical protein
MAVDVFVLLGPATISATPELVNIGCADSLGSDHAAIIRPKVVSVNSRIM